jgi:AraC-like DNA-binding protein
MKIPVLHIRQFHQEKHLKELYVNSLSKHLESNEHLIDKPHSHDFYLCVLFLQGRGVHEIDFKTYPISPGSVFFLKPGQTHFWNFASPPEGFIFFHSQSFYELNFLGHGLSFFPFYCSLQNPPLLEVPVKVLNALGKKFEEAFLEYSGNVMLREMKILNLINGIYIELTRCYTSLTDMDKSYSPGYSALLSRLEALIENYFREEKLPQFYANRLNITTKHLNRVVKSTINKTTSELISERVVLEAKRMIVHSTVDLAEVAFALDFSDYAYFSKFFKDKTGRTPSAFRKAYR